MKILWITNSLAFPDICNALNIPEPQLGGWMKSMLISISSMYPDLQFGIATLYTVTKQLIKRDIKNVTYYCIPGNPSTSYNKKLETFWKEINNDFCPDVVHIHGTEFSHGLAYMRVCGSSNVCISLQGVVSGIERYNLGGIQMDILRKYRTLYDYFKTSVTQMQKSMHIRAELEKEYFNRCMHIIGRTDWDKTHVWSVNPRAHYHFCNENLRSSFYLCNTWQYDKCQKYRIFLSQAASPLKGIQKVIEALPIVLRDFPDVEVYVAGNDYTLRKTLKDKLKFRAYPNYICHLMDNLKVRDKIHFTGFLDEKGMIEQYLKAHIFVCPSSVENSPNSLGEAQLLGVPCIGSIAGGIPSMIEHGKTGLLYRFEEYEYLAKYICQLFYDNELVTILSENGSKEAAKRHDSETNARMMFHIYQEVCKR